MLFLHISDLHLGKVIHGVSMLENGDQPYWVNHFLSLTKELQPDAVLISGDVYDRGSPSGAAVELLSRLVEGLASMGVCVLLVDGNHDSGQRLAFARDILARQNVHIAGTVERTLTHVTLQDEYGPVTFWLMPYIFPAAVAQVLDDETIRDNRDYGEAARRLLAAQEIDTSARNVLLAHQYVTAFGVAPQQGGSESSVGGVGQIDYTVFDDFDYVALGHIHAAYPVGRETVRYAGSPMCYHFNETRQAAKGPVLVNLGPKGALPVIETRLIHPLHPMREMRGEFETLREKELERKSEGEYLRLVITDQPMTPEVSDFFQKLAEQRGSVLMERVSEYRRFSEDIRGLASGAIREKTLEELFADFFAHQRGGEEPDRDDLDLLRQAGELLRNTPPDPTRRDRADIALTDKLLEYLLGQEAVEE